MDDWNEWLSPLSDYLFYALILDTMEQTSTNYHSQAKSGLLPIFVNKVLLEHSHAHLFINMYCLWLLSWCNSRAE